MSRSLYDALRTLFVFVVVFPGVMAFLFLVTGQNTGILYSFLVIYFLLLVVAALAWLSKKIG